jgi:hypothetical protein
MNLHKMTFFTLISCLNEGQAKRELLKFSGLLQKCFRALAFSRSGYLKQ